MTDPREEQYQAAKRWLANAKRNTGTAEHLIKEWQAKLDYLADQRRRQGWHGTTRRERLKQPPLPEAKWWRPGARP